VPAEAASAAVAAAAMMRDFTGVSIGCDFAQLSAFGDERQRNELSCSETQNRERQGPSMNFSFQTETLPTVDDREE
jgi:hypothetical protein